MGSWPTANFYYGVDYQSDDNRQGFPEGLIVKLQNLLRFNNPVKPSQVEAAFERVARMEFSHLPLEFGGNGSDQRDRFVALRRFWASWENSEEVDFEKLAISEKEKLEFQEFLEAFGLGHLKPAWRIGAHYG